jgi:putative ubiquitin-RnfH superfamily antitoxin RatB of RatAB toxin-antitoxin module
MARVEVVFCPAPGQVDAVTLDLPAGATLADALQTSGLLARHPLDLTEASFGIWGRKRPADTVLRERDRVEVYRALTVDPKEARRLRYKRHRGG